MKHSLLFLRAVLTLPLAFELAATPMPAVPDRQTALPDILVLRRVYNRSEPGQEVRRIDLKAANH